ncbi:MAG: hypothetical protein ACK4UO_08195 [Pseudolabrys sp.]
MPVPRTLRRSIAPFAAAALAIVASIGPAWAPGSLPLHEVQAAVRSAPKLVDEIARALKASGRAAGDVVCWASRHGHHFKYLAGRRAAPYECTIGQRTLTIEAEITYYDARGRPLGDVDAADPRLAKTFRERNFRWTWAP